MTIKDPSIETLRGLAIILVVAGHAIGDGPQYAMRVSDDSWLRYFNYSFQFLRMPLFTVISGWIYAMRPVNSTDFSGFISGKARRLLVPMLFVGAIYYLTQHFVPGTTLKHEISGIWRLLVFPFTLYWYLPSLFFVFLIVAGLDMLKKLQPLLNWSVVLIIAVIMLILRTYFITDEAPNYLSYKGVIYLLPFFLIGVGLKRYPVLFNNKAITSLVWICLITGVVIQQLIWYGVIDYYMSKGTGIGLMIGLSGAILLLKVRFHAKYLAWLGGFSYTIYLFHAFGTAGARIISTALGLHSPVLIVIFAITAGLFLPILADKIFDRNSLTRLLLLGRNYLLTRKLFSSNPVSV